jgi:hypothetical protein
MLDGYCTTISNQPYAGVVFPLSFFSPSPSGCRLALTISNNLGAMVITVPNNAAIAQNIAAYVKRLFPSVTRATDQLRPSRKRRPYLHR